MKQIVFNIALLIIILASPLTTSAQHQTGSQGYHNQSAYPKLNYDSLFEAATPLSQSTEGQALLDNCLKAYGGKEDLGRIGSLRFEWKLKALMEKDSIDVTRTFTRQNQHRIDLRHSDGTITSRFMTGDTAWQQTSDSAFVMDRNRTTLENFHYLSLSLPLSISDPKFDEIRYGTRDGSSLGYLMVRLEDKLIFSIGIDPATHWVMVSEGVAIDQELRLVFVNLFSEHSLKNGLLIPHRYNFISMGLMVGEYRLLKLELNPDLPDGYFRP